MPSFDQGGPGFSNEMHCSFCGKSRSQVSKLIAGPGGVFICDECVHACTDMIDENDLAEAEVEEAAAADDGLPIKNLPTPHEIYDELSQYVMGQEQAKRARVWASSVLPVPVGPSSKMLLLAISTSSSPSATSSLPERMRR